MRTWAYKTTWTYEEVPEYWRSIWGNNAFNCKRLGRQWSILDAAKFLRVKSEKDVVGSFSVII